MVVSKLTLHGVESRELVVSDSLVLSASLGFLRRSGSKRGSACFGKIWSFPAPFPLDPSPGSEWFAHKKGLMGQLSQECWRSSFPSCSAEPRSGVPMRGRFCVSPKNALAATQAL